MCKPQTGADLIYNVYLPAVMNFLEVFVSGMSIEH